MKLRYPVLAAALVGLLLPSLAIAGERYRGPGMMWDGGLFHMFFGFLMMILFLAIVVGVVVLLVRWLGGSEHPLFRPTGQPSRTRARHPEGAPRQGRDRRRGVRGAEARSG